MPGVVFIVTIPTENEEQGIVSQEQPSKFGHSSKSDAGQKYESGAFKVGPQEGLLLESRDDHDERSLLDIPQDSSMECIMNELFKQLKINNAVWQLTKNKRFNQITFSVESNAHVEVILATLNEWGIGQQNGSTLSMISCTIYNQSTESDADQQDTRSEKESTWGKFMNKFRARWNVAQIVQRVKEDATITFDFVTLILVAGMLAAFGLIENDSTAVVSSMLISPLMGPVIATIFGIVIKDHALIRFSVINEVIGISMATMIGFIFGLIVCSIDTKYAYGSEAALTAEMVRRCQLHAILVGICTALPTGAAAAIAILAENVGSLVGVAISVSLLPPAVNAGVLWALAVIYKVNEKDEELFSKLIQTNFYSNNQSIELAVYGLISLALTIVNVICIILVGVLTLKIKEVAPLTKKHHRLWKHDIKIARNFNKTSNSSEDRIRNRQMVEDISQMRKNEDQMRGMFADSYQHTWSPMTTQLPTFNRDRVINDLEAICLHMAIPTSSHYENNVDNLSASYVSKRRATLPSASSITKANLEIPCLKAINKTQLEKIPEIVITSSNDERNKSSDSDNSNNNNNNNNSKRTNKFIVTPADINIEPA